MLSMSIDTSELENTLARGINAIESGVRNAVELACTEGANEAKTKHAYQDQTGELTRSIDGYLETSSKTEATGVIEAKARYASFVDAGTKPHDIRPKSRRAKRGGMLAWEQPQGDWHFAKLVHHPGTRPYGFMGLAYLKAERVIEREVEVACEKVAAMF